MDYKLLVTHSSLVTLLRITSIFKKKLTKVEESNRDSGKSKENMLNSGGFVPKVEAIEQSDRVSYETKEESDLTCYCGLIHLNVHLSV